MYDYTAQVITVAASVLLLATVLVYERWVSRLKAERDAALDHADEAQELLDAILGLEQQQRAAAARHPSNVRLLRSVDGGAS